MWPARSALRPVPPYAVVGRDTVDNVEADLSEGTDLESRIVKATEDLAGTQPGLHTYLRAEMDGIHDETAQALGEFLTVLVHRSFVRAFGIRLRPVTESVLATAQMALAWDEELRRGAAEETLESDDLVAMGQPHLVASVREQVEAALEPDEDGEPADVDLDAVAAVYRTVLVEVLVLGQSVAPPRGTLTTESLA